MSERKVKKWGYHPTEAARIFEVPAASPSLPEGWYESPAEYPQEPAGGGGFEGGEPTQQPATPPTGSAPHHQHQNINTPEPNGDADGEQGGAKEGETPQEISSEDERLPKVFQQWRDEQDIEQLRAIAEQKGLNVDRRWSIETIKNHLEALEADTNGDNGTKADN